MVKMFSVIDQLSRKISVSNNVKTDMNNEEECDIDSVLNSQDLMSAANS